MMVIGRLKLWLAGAGVFIVALLSIWFGGKRSGQTDAKLEELNEYIETRKRIDEIDRHKRHPDAREFLRERGQR